MRPQCLLASLEAKRVVWVVNKHVDSYFTQYKSVQPHPGHSRTAVRSLCSWRLYAICCYTV